MYAVLAHLIVFPAQVQRIVPFVRLILHGFQAKQYVLLVIVLLLLNILVQLMGNNFVFLNFLIVNAYNVVLGVLLAQIKILALLVIQMDFIKTVLSVFHAR